MGGSEFLGFLGVLLVFTPLLSFHVIQDIQFYENSMLDKHVCLNHVLDEACREEVCRVMGSARR